MDPQTKKKLPGLGLLSFSTFVVCIAAAFTQVLSLDLMVDLNSFPSKAYSWTFPLFIAGECAAMGLCLAIIDRYGRKWPFVIGAFMFMFSSIGCALSTGMELFLACRFFEGFGAGIVIIVGMAQVFFDIEDRKERYLANGIMSLGFGLGMLVGIFLGRAVIDVIGWRIAFWSFAVMLAIITYPCMKVLENGERSERKADVPGGILLAIWSTTFVLYLQKLYLDWSIKEPMGQLGLVVVIILFILFLVAEAFNPNSVFHRKVDDRKLVAASMIFIVILGIVDMAAVGAMVKIAFFTYQMSVLEAAPYFVILVLGAAVTAIAISKTIDRTGHLPWLLLSAVLSPIALLSMQFVSPDDPSILFAVHLFLLGLANGCLVSMLNATIQNRTTVDTNGAYIGFAMMLRTASLWLGYNLYTMAIDAKMREGISDFLAYWNSFLPVQLPADSNLANLLVTPLRDLIELLPGLTAKIADVFASGVAESLMLGSILFVVVAIPAAIFLVGRRKTL